MLVFVCSLVEYESVYTVLQYTACLTVGILSSSPYHRVALRKREEGEGMTNASGAFVRKRGRKGIPFFPQEEEGSVKNTWMYKV